MGEQKWEYQFRIARMWMTPEPVNKEKRRDEYGHGIFQLDLDKESKLSKVLDLLGAEGWELVSTELTAERELILFLKRPKKET